MADRNICGKEATLIKATMDYMCAQFSVILTEREIAQRKYSFAKRKKMYKRLGIAAVILAGVALIGLINAYSELQFFLPV